MAAGLAAGLAGAAATTAVVGWNWAGSDAARRVFTVAAAAGGGLVAEVAAGGLATALVEGGLKMEAGLSWRFLLGVDLDLVAPAAAADGVKIVGDWNLTRDELAAAGAGVGASGGGAPGMKVVISV